MDDLSRDTPIKKYGVSNSKIVKKLNISRNRVIDYLNMTPMHSLTLWHPYKTERKNWIPTKVKY